MRLPAARTGEAIAQASGELARIWRAARHAGARPAALEGVVAPFVEAAGAALRAGAAPEAAWASTAGVVRLERPAGAEAEAELALEWSLLAEVLAAACRTLEADPAATDLVARAVEAGRRGAGRLALGERHPGVLVVWRLVR